MIVGCVGYATEQGIGHLPKWFYDAGVIQKMMVFRHGSRDTHLEWYPKGTIELVNRPFTGAAVEEFVKSVDIMLFFETPFDWQFPDLCRRLGKKTVLMPMYEWYPKHPPHQFDLLLAPSLLDKDYFPDSVYLPVPVFYRYWRQRYRAERFLHNAGNIGCRGHKGTLELLQAMRYVTNPRVTLTVRAQDGKGLKQLLKQVPSVLKDKRVTISTEPVPYDCLWDDHDVLIAPEKLNGLSLPLQEARAAGMLVMTTDRYPTNTWLPKYGLIPPSSVSRASMGGAYLEFDECRLEPSVIGRHIDLVYGTDIYDYSLSGRTWAEENSWPALAPRYIATLEALLR